MGAILALAGLALVALPGRCHVLGRRLTPHMWVRLCAAALIIGGITFEIGLLLYSLPSTIRILQISKLTTACERMLSFLAPGGPIAGWTALVIAAIVAILGLRGWSTGRSARFAARTECWIGDRLLLGDHRVVIVSTDEIVAFSVDGDPGQIIVSRGLVAALTDDEFTLVLAHESAHLDRRHYRPLALAGVLSAALSFFPPVGQSVTALRTALERSADEIAANAVEGGRVLLGQALRQITATAVGIERAAFSSVDTVIERLEALDAPLAQLTWASRAALYTPGIVIGAVLAVGFSSWVSAFGMLVEMASHCRLWL